MPKTRCTSLPSGPGRQASSRTPPEQDLLKLADQCVKCGYCLPHCPTFRLRRDEAESPRGRIALVQGWLWGEIGDGERLDVHLSNCLECRACEPVCPSLVQFGQIMDQVRALRAARQPAWRRLLRRVRLDLFADTGRWRPLARAALLYRRGGLSRIASALGLTRWPRLALLHRLAGRLELPRSLIAGADDGELELFLGCIARDTQAATAESARRVLTRLGVPVSAANGQGCCGAIHRHNGEPAAAGRLARRNAELFGERTVVGFASACVAEMKEHSRIHAVELCRFLVDRDWPVGLSVAPLEGTVAVHEPCSHRNLLRDTAAVYALLGRIPRLQVMPLAENDVCCGAAGTYLLDHPDTARELSGPKIAYLRTLRPDYLVTTNTGCALHLAVEIEAAGLDIEVLHPVELLERQIGRDRSVDIR